MKLHRLPLLAAAASLAFAPAQLNAQTTAATDPVGFVTVNIAAGATNSPKPTFFSIPLQDVEGITGQVAGALTGVTSNSLVNSNAGWVAGALSQPATPYIIQLTSGTGAGRIFLIAASANTAGASGSSTLSNTATTVFISPLDSTSVTNLSTLGVAAGDTYKIYACDTIGSFFGVPPALVRGGSATTNSDTIQTLLNGSTATYWYNTTLNRWSRQGAGSPDSANVALVPNYGVIYNRRTNSPMSFTVTGQVPVAARAAMIKNSGLTMLSSYWPSTTTLSNVGLQNLPIWTSSSSASTADIVTLTTTSGTVNNYFFDGANWRRQAAGSPVTNPVIDIGTSLQINQKGSTAGFTPLQQNVPYSLN